MNPTAHILVVDDEESICYVLKVNLELAGYHVDTASCAMQALKMPLEQYDLLLLDVMMDDIDGYELARQVRQRDECRNIPIIFCTARDSEDDVLTGFGTGADDYIKKPFSMKELQARVSSVLRRANNAILNNATLLSYQSLKVNLASRTCTVHDEPVQLTRKEFDMLVHLMQNRDHVFSRDELLTAVWKHDVYVIDRTVDVTINRLRKKLGDCGKYIITQHGYGYGFKTDV